jgi:hypothetical protein
MYHHHITRAIVVALVAIGALAPTGGALAQPADSVIAKWPSHDGQITKVTPQQLPAAFGTHGRATPGTITFTNPLDRSRGPGAGAGLL